jgi:hypothetical protein
MLYNDMYIWLSNNRYNKEDLYVLDKEIVYAQRVDGSVYKLLVARNYDRDGKADCWSYSCVKAIKNLLEKKGRLYYFTMDDNYDVLGRFAERLGFQKITKEQMFYRS